MNAALAHKMIAAMAGRGAPLPPPMPGVWSVERRQLSLSACFAGKTVASHVS